MMSKLSLKELNSKKILLEKLASIYRNSCDQEPDFSRSELFHEIARNEKQLDFVERNPELIQEFQSERQIVRNDFDELIASNVFEMDVERISNMAVNYQMGWRCRDKIEQQIGSSLPTSLEDLEFARANCNWLVTTLNVNGKTEQGMNLNLDSFALARKPNH